MLGRAVVIAAGAMCIAGAAAAQTSEPASQPVAKSSTLAKAEPQAERPRLDVPAEPDPLTPPEVTGPPPAAPAVPVEAKQPEAQAPAASTAAAKVEADPVVAEVRQRLATAGRARESVADAADRAGLVAYYGGANARTLWTDADGFNARAVKTLDELRNADDWGLKAAAFDLPLLPPGAPTTAARADAEIKLGLAALKYARHARGGRLDPRAVSQLLDRRAQVYDPATLIAALAVASAPDTYLRGLHPKHAGFRNLQKALIAARTATAPVAEPDPVAEEASGKAKGKGKQAAKTRPRTPQTKEETINRIVANMERWRWMPDDLGAFHVWNNVPDQITTVYKDGKAVFTERIVVGKPGTPTPNFTADMQFVIFQPEWGVPGGIKNNEIGPMLRRASAEGSSWFGGNGRTPASVLARHNLRVSVGGQVVNPDSINWSQVDINRFNFIQPSGPRNVLGVVKFRFPNKHDVYMHDTPEKHLFGSGTRAFSHGCMRVQNPVRLAEVLLEHDKGWSSDRVRQMVPRGGEVKLSTQIPVHNVYFTAMADETGKLRTAGDLYGVDSRILSALEGRSVAIASRGEPAAGGEVAQRVKDGAPRQAKRRQSNSTASVSQGSNPFAGLFGN